MAYRLPTAGSKGGPSTDAALRGAIRTVHTAGADAARAALNKSLANEYWRTGRGLTMATTARVALDTYIHLSAGDDRPSFAGKPVAYRLDGDEISVNIDVVLFDDDGYCGRICVTGPLASPLSKPDRTLLAAPALLALASELEDGFWTVHTLEVWELRGGQRGTITRAEAEAAVPSIRALLERLR